MNQSKEVTVSDYQRPRCPRCGGRLFLEGDFQGRRHFYLWVCSLGCSRRYDLAGKPLTRRAEDREFVAVIPSELRTLELVGVR